MSDIDIKNVIYDKSIEGPYDKSTDTSWGKIYALSVIDIFEYENNEILKVNVNQLRTNKNMRLQRSEDFYCVVHHAILNNDDQFYVECNDMDNFHLRSIMTSHYFQYYFTSTTLSIHHNKNYVCIKVTFFQ